MKVDIFRIGSDYFAQAASGEMWRVRGNMLDHSATGKGLLPLPEGKMEVLCRLDALGEKWDRHSVNLGNMNDVLRDVQQSIEMVPYDDIMVNGRAEDAHLDSSILSTERYAFKLDNDVLMVSVMSEANQPHKWEVSRVGQRRNIVAEAVLRADLCIMESSRAVFHRPTGAFF